MIESDTVKLLRECDAGIKTGVSSIQEVIGYVRSEDMRGLLTDCKTQHEKLKHEIQGLLDDYHDNGKSPNPFAQGMSWFKTNINMTINASDSTIADLMTDGCNMGVKSLNRYLNQYQAADQTSKNITKRLIGIEQQLADDMRHYL